jgi:hypothetical protein
MITKGQQYAPELLYVPIPQEVTDIGLRGLERVTYNGESLSMSMGEPSTPIVTEVPTADGEEGGGCLVATASFGSELAPQVQLLREIRSNALLGTHSGTTFMAGFNEFYYSFSPAVADLERQNPLFKELVRITITPMLSTLSILNYANVDSEQEVLGYGIGIILLNIGMYFVAPAFIIMKIKSKLSR